MNEDTVNEDTATEIDLVSGTMEEIDKILIPFVPS